MILNEHQLHASKESLEALQHRLADFRIENDFSIFEKSHLTEKIKELDFDIKKYEGLKQYNFTSKNEVFIDELPEILINSRISQSVSQNELASRIGITERLIQQYENSAFFGVSTSRLIKISNALNINLNKICRLDDNHNETVLYDISDIETIDYNKFPTKEIEKNGWLSDQDKTQSVESFINNSFSFGLSPVYHKKSTHAGRTPKEYSLLAWQAQVLKLADDVITKNNVPEFYLNDTWLPELISLSHNENGPVLAQQFLQEKGIVLIIERHLSGTYLDGAAMLSESGNPVIGMTLRFNRIDNFWFVLAHELGHIFKHLFLHNQESFIDEKVGLDNGDLNEAEANAFAQELLTPSHAWDKCMSKVFKTTKAVLGDAKKFDIHPAFIAGRIRQNDENYTILSDLIGQNEIRKLFFK